MCWLFHKWSKWEDRIIQMKHVEPGNTFEYTKRIQYRNCLICNKLQVEDV